MAAPASLASEPLGQASFLEALTNRGNASRGGDGNEVSFAEEDEEWDDNEDDDAEADEDELEGVLDLGGARGPGGIIAPGHAHEDVRQTMGHHGHVKKLEGLQRDYVAKVAAAEDAKSVLEHEEQRLRALRRQAAQSNAAGDATRLKYQEGEVSKAWARLTDKEKARDLAELALHQIADSGSVAARQVLQDNVLQSAIARERQLDEVTRATRIVNEDLQARQAAEDTRQMEEEERDRRYREGVRHKGKSTRRLQDSFAVDSANLEIAESVREARFDQDAQRVLGLKESMDRIGRQVRASNEKRAKQKEKQKKDNEQRKKELLNQGLNPYEVYRREMIDAEKEKQKVEMEQRRMLRSERLLEQLLTEDKRYKKNMEEEKQKRVEAEEFQRQMGNYAKEKKIEAYIRKMTIGNVNVLDPTGAALRIDPSKVTIQRTHRFGLGKGVSMDEIKKVDKQVQSAKQKAATWKPPRGPGTDDVGDLVGNVDARASATDSEVFDDGREPPPDGKLWVPKLSPLEEQYLAAARQRQKENMTSVQRCWGREFKGDAFLAKPSVIAFKDFEVGKRYRQVVEVTNVSLTFNQFKLLPLDDRVKEFFEIEFVPPGRMSAGVTRYITVWFIPRLAQDIKTTFPILAKTGRIDFPMVCTTKKTILSILPQDANANPVIDFKQVIFGEEGHQVLHVNNTGALASKFTFEPTDDSDQLLSMLTYDMPSGEFGAHATTSIRFTFKPKVLGDFTTRLRLSIDNGASGDAKFAEEREVVVRGSCSDVPITVEQKEYDFRTCLHEHTFRENIMVLNRQQTAMKVTVERPKLIEGQLQITPNVAFVQGLDQQALQVKFKPRSDFLSQHSEYIDSSRPGVVGAFRIPVRIKGADQVEPILTALVGTLTGSEISFSPQYLDFGRCFVGSSVVGRVTIINESLLPQQVAFLRLPPYLVVSDVPTDVIEEEKADSSDNGPAVLDGGGSAQFSMLLPLERRELCITYTPNAAMELNYGITVKTVCGSLCVHDYTLQCKGQGITPVLQLSHSSIEMASIPVDAHTKESVVITNQSKVPHIMNLLPPPAEVSCLHITPICCLLEPMEQRRIQLEFKPTKDYVEFLQMPVEETKHDEGADADAPAAEGGADVTEDRDVVKTTPADYRKMKLKLIRQNGGRRWEVPAKTKTVTKDTSASDGEAPGGGADVDDGDYGGLDVAGGGSTAKESGLPTGATEDTGASGDGSRGVVGTVHCSWRLAICMKPFSADVEQEPSGNKNATTYLAVRTCVLPTLLTAEPSSLDFGKVTAGQRESLPITLHNAIGDEPQELHLEALPENACFTVLNAPRTIGKGPFKLVVEFNPERVQIYQTSLKLYTQNTRMQVPLSGRGVRPVLNIEPEDGIINLGSIVYSKESKDYVQAKVEIKNSSPFPLVYNLETMIPADPCHVGPSPFTLTPSTAVVEKHGQKTVTVTFRPYRPLEVFKEKVYVNVPNQKEPTYLYLYGHCFKYQGFVIPPMVFGSFNRTEAKRQDAFLDALAVGSGSNVSPDAEFSYQRAQRKEISLVFERGETSKYIWLGAGVQPGTPNAPQQSPAINYDIQIQQSQFSGFFTVEMEIPGGKPDKMAKGPLLPGKLATKAVFKYNAPEDTSLTCGDTNLDMLSGIGQWVTCKVKCIVSGGYVPPPDPPATTQEVMVELKAYMTKLF